MGWLGSLLQRFRGPHAPAATLPPPAEKAPAAAKPTPESKPVESAKRLETTKVAMTKVAAAAQGGAVAKPVEPLSEQEAAARERKELLEFKRTLQHGILDERFAAMDVDQRFRQDFTRLLNASEEAFALPPATAFDVMRLVDDPAYPVKKVAAAISCDPALAGSVLSLANSPLHRGDVIVESLPTAVVRLGQRHLKLLLLEIALHSTRVKGKPFEVFSTLTWKHSLLAAQIAAMLAPLCGVDPDHAYMAGLFHDVGVFTVLTGARKLSLQQTRSVTSQTVLALLREHAHAQNGRVVARWKLPEIVSLAVIHHRDFDHAREASRLAAVTRVANDLCKRYGAWTEHQALDLAQHAALRFLGIDVEKLPDEKRVLLVAAKIEKVSRLQ